MHSKQTFAHMTWNWTGAPEKSWYQVKYKSLTFWYWPMVARVNNLQNLGFLVKKSCLPIEFSDIIWFVCHKGSFEGFIFTLVNVCCFKSVKVVDVVGVWLVWSPHVCLLDLNSTQNKWCMWCDTGLGQPACWLRVIGTQYLESGEQELKKN